MKGDNIMFKPNAAKLLILILFITALPIHAQPTGSWEAIPGLNATVDVIKVKGDDLIVGGLFESAGGDNNANYIAKWNGTNWEAFGTGLEGWCTSIAFIGDDIYAGGSFPGFIRKWDGSEWSSVGGGLNLHVNTLAVNGNDLYVGGAFRNAGGNPDADRIAKWNGSSWEAMDKGFNETNDWIFTIAIHNGAIYAGGQFTSVAGDTNAKYIAKWNDTDSVWESFGNGLNHQVHHIAFHDDVMYIGGYFTNAGGDPNANRIAKWNGTSWEGLGPGLNGFNNIAEVEEFIFDGDDIYVAGQFNIIGDDSTFYNIAKWNGTNWEKFGFGLDQETRTLVIFNNDLFVGGSFSAEGPGGQGEIHNIARWRNVSTAVNENDNSLISEFRLHQNYPNPFNPTTTLSFVISHSSFVTIKVYDILGKEITTLINEHKPAGTYEVVFNAGNLPSGVYFYKLSAGEFIQTRKMLLLK